MRPATVRMVAMTAWTRGRRTTRARTTTTTTTPRTGAGTTEWISEGRGRGEVIRLREDESWEGRRK
jgi:hypothetical protein